MILWTIQPVEAVGILNKDGFYTCNPSLSENYEDMQDAYQWMVAEMDKRNIYHPKDLKLPLWAWHTRNWKHKKPDFRTIGLGCRGERYACIEFEIPDDQVLLSDYDNWHFVLNECWFDDSTNEEEWNKLQDWYDSLNNEDKDKIMVESWQKIFDVTPRKEKWNYSGAYVQAVFWELRKEMVRDIKYFVAK